MNTYYDKDGFPVDSTYNGEVFDSGGFPVEIPKEYSTPQTVELESVTGNEELTDEELPWYQLDPNGDAMQTASTLFPRSKTANEEDAGFFDRTKAAIGDYASFPGRAVSAIGTSIFSDKEGEEFGNEVMSQMREPVANEEQSWYSALPENVIKDPALPFTAGIGAALTGAKTIATLVRNLPLVQKVVSSLPGIKNTVGGMFGGFADVAVNDQLNEHAEGAPDIGMADYALGGMGGALMPYATKSAKKLGQTIGDFSKVYQAGVPRYAPDEFRPVAPFFGVEDGSTILRSPKPSKHEDGGWDVPLGATINRTEGVGGLDRQFLQSSNSVVIPKSSLRGSIDQLKRENPGTTRTSIAIEKLAEGVSEKIVNPLTRGYNRSAIEVANDALKAWTGTVNTVGGIYNNTMAPVAGATIRELGPIAAGVVNNSGYRLPMDLLHLKNELPTTEYGDVDVDRWSNQQRNTLGKWILPK